MKKKWYSLVCCVSLGIIISMVYVNDVVPIFKEYIPEVNTEEEAYSLKNLTFCRDDKSISREMGKLKTSSKAKIYDVDCDKSTPVSKEYLSILTSLQQKNEENTVVYYPVTKHSLRIMGAPKVWKEKDHKNRKITGTGIRVAVIDSGLDMKHKDFKDVTLSVYDLEHNKKRVTDKMGHGTHVAGIVHKVAPGASLFAYQFNMFNVDNMSARVIKGIKEAVKKKVDVINLSLGVPFNIPTSSLVREINKAINQGIIVVVAMGNDGPSNWTMGLPATSSKAISVGASTEVVPCPYIHLAGGREVELLPVNQSPRFRLKGNYAMHYVGIGQKRADYKEARGKIAVVQRSKKKNAKSLQKIAQMADEAGAVALVMYNHSSGEFEPASLEFDSLGDKLLRIPIAVVAGEKGMLLRQEIKSGKSIHFSFKKKEKLCSFSSRGPVSSSWALKPDVVAPGEEIWSAGARKAELNPENKKHVRMSGTSMAAPQVAGAVALIKQAHPLWTPDEIKAALANTAVPLKNGANKIGPILGQGSGRIDIFKAIHTETLAMPNNISFGNHQPNLGKKTLLRNVELKNISSKRKQYSIHGKVNTTHKGIKVVVPSKKELSGKSRTTIPIRLKVDTNSVPRGIYSGSVCFQEGKNEIRIPFIFLLEPKSSSPIEGVKIREKKKNTFTISYYLSSSVDKIDLVTEGLLYGKKNIILHVTKDKCKKGYHHITWKGTTWEGKKLSEEPYILDAKVTKSGKTSRYNKGMPFRLFELTH